MIYILDQDPSQRQFEDRKQTLDTLLTKLYNLGAEDSAIPLINEQV
jgi:hypothetical protein